MDVARGGFQHGCCHPCEFIGESPCGSEDGTTEGNGQGPRDRSGPGLHGQTIDGDDPYVVWCHGKVVGEDLADETVLALPPLREPHFYDDLAKLVDADEHALG